MIEPFSSELFEENYNSIETVMITAKNTGSELPTMVVSTTIQIGYINLHVIEVTLLGNFNENELM